MITKGYKAFDSNLRCRDFQFEVGQTYSLNGELKICKHGFHFCLKLNDVFDYYPTSYDTRVCEIEALSEVQSEENKSCTLKIKILRELSKEEIKALTDDLKFNSGNYNSGKYNSGHYNSGNYNSGSRNSGNCNSGDYNSGKYNSGSRNSGHCNSGKYNSGNYNSGQYNSGHYNSGHYNSGNYNSGQYNSGNYNSGHYNSGDYNLGSRNSGQYNSGDYNSGYHNSGAHNSGSRNSGDYNSGGCNSGNYNSGNRNSGYFNTNTPKVRLFNQNSDLDWNNPIIYRLKSLNLKPILQWVYESSMTEDEKKNYPSYKTTGGYLKNTGKQDWSSLSDEDKKFIQSLPGYNEEIFKEITGISLTK